MTDSDPDSITISNQSGGADLDAGRDITIGGDVVGRDKVVSIAGDNIAGDKIINVGDQQYDVQGLANPYLGLQSFTYADHAKYAGREKLIYETVARLTAPDDPLALLFVTGASGSGKSSFVQAGVLPALEKHYAALSMKWAVFRPSRDPLAALSDALWRQLGLSQFDPTTDFGDFLKTHTPPQQVNVIVIDQFEELFTQSNAQPRDALFALLMQLPPFRSTRTHIIATVRADYLPELFGLPALYDVAKRGIDLRAMSVDELREAIQQPLRVTYPDKDKRFQPELVERLAQDAAEDAAYLPLLQVTLEEIWRKGALTVGSYTNLADAIKQRADKVLAYQDYDAAQPDQPRTPEEQAAILNLCLDLVDVSLDDEARRDVRRRRSKDELISGAPERARLIDTLAQARLLSVSADSSESTRVEVDLIHETLLSNWDRLRQAIAERRHELRQRVRFEQQLKEWIGQNRSDEYVLSGVRLAEARDLEHHDDIALRNAEAKDFVRRSIEREEAHRQKELDDARRLAEAESQRAESEKLRAEEQTRSASRLKRVLLVVALLAFVALVLGFLASVFGIQSNQAADAAQTAEAKAVAAANSRATAEANALAQRDEAQRQSRISLSRQLAAQSLSHVDNQFDLALLLSIESRSVVDTVEARNSLFTGLERHPGLMTILQAHTGVKSVAFSPNGEILASGGANSSIILWDVSNPKSPSQLGTLSGHSNVVLSVTFSPDGKTLASQDWDHKIILWDVSNPKSPIQLGTLSSYAGEVSSVAFSPDGTMLASGNANKTITLWNVSNPKDPVQWGSPLSGHSSIVLSVTFSPDGNTLASSSADGTIILWDVSNPKIPIQLGAPLSGQKDWVSSLAFSPDGKTLATGSWDKTIVLWDVSNPKIPIQLGAPLSGQKDWVLSLAFSPDGKILASSSADKTIVLWDVSNPKTPVQLGAPLSGHNGTVESVAFSPDGKTLASGGADSTVMLWDVSNLQSPVQLGAPLSGHNGTVESVAFSPDGKTLASGSVDQTIILQDVSNPKLPVQLSTLSSHSDMVLSVAFSPDRKILASSNRDNTITLWDVSNPKMPLRLGVPLRGHNGNVLSVAFSPDGKTLASGSADDTIIFYAGTIILWDVSNPKMPFPLATPLSGQDCMVESVAFSPDGKTLASSCLDKIILWDVSNLKEPVQLGSPLFHGNSVESVAFSPDSKTLASGSMDNTIILWDVSNPKAPGRLGAPLSSYTREVKSVAFSPNGKTLASGNGDNTITLWDVSNPKTPAQLGSPLYGHTGSINSVAFSPDGRTLASGSSDKTIILWDVDTASWQARACQIVGRNLTRAEWQQYMGDEPYRKTCDQWPLEPEETLTPTP